MLNKFKMFAVIAVAAMAFTGCEKEETSISINDLPGRAKVKGTVYYSNAQKYVKETEDTDAMLKDLFVAKGEVKVLARIANSDVVDGEAYGYTVFETMTDAEGHYEFELPVLENGLSIELEALPFESTKSTFDSLYRKEPKFSDKAGVFENASVNVKLYPNDIKNQDIKYGFTAKADTKLEENAEDNFTKTYLKVYVLEAYYSSYWNSPRFTTSYSPVEVKISDGNNIDKTQKTETGEVLFEILHTTKGEKEVTITVSSSSYANSIEVPYYTGDKVYGEYKQFYSTDDNWRKKDITKVWENAFKEEQVITVSYDEGSREANVFLVFKPNRMNVDFTELYGEQYYEEWVEAFFNY